MKVLITGANGFLGRKIVKKLVASGNDGLSIRCLVRKGSSLNGLEVSDVEIFRGSLNDDSIYQRLLNGVDVLIHLAASMGGSPMGMFNETVVSTEKLIEHVNDSRVSKIIFCSSFSVYGASELSSGGELNENCPIEKKPHKRDAYAWCKYYQELWIKERVKNAILIVMRPGVIYGEGQGLLSPRVGMKLPGLPFFLKIGGRARLPLTHVKNCADAFVLAVFKDDLTSQDFNIVDDECPTQKEYLKIYQSIFGHIPHKIPVPYVIFLLMSFFLDKLHVISKGNFPGIFSTYKAKSMYRKFRYSNQKLKSVLGWSQNVSLQEGLKDSVDFL